MYIQETENLHYFPHMHAISQHHTRCNVHIHPGNGKLTLLSTHACNITTTHTIQRACRPRKGKTYITFHITCMQYHNTIHDSTCMYIQGTENSHYFPRMHVILQQHTRFNMHVDPGNGKLTLLSTSHACNITTTYTIQRACRSRKRKTYITFHTCMQYHNNIHDSTCMYIQETLQKLRC